MPFLFERELKQFNPGFGTNWGRAQTRDESEYVSSKVPNANTQIGREEKWSKVKLLTKKWLAATK